MTVVIYSTNSNVYIGNDFDVKTFPLNASRWECLAKSLPEHKFIICTQMPGMFLLDVRGNDICLRADNVEYLLCEHDSSCPAGGSIADAMAKKIIPLNPDIAIAATFWVTPYDWLGIQDGMVADFLEKAGIKTFCHPLQTSLVSFDKFRTHQELERLGMKIPPAVYVHHDLYWCERSRRELRANVYKEYVLSQIKDMNYPVVIKDTVGLSSYGMEVAVSYKQAVHYLNLGRTNSDRLVEEYIDGIPFGTEIYGSDGKYEVMPPFMFSLNRYGITSPKQSVKLGPVLSEKYNVLSLKEMLAGLACKMNFCGVAQVDLIFKGGSWYIIEINPRLSGMTETYASSLGLSVPEILFNVAIGKKVDSSLMKCVCNIKLPLLSDEQMEILYGEEYVLYLHQLHNLAAKQEREKGYCEAVIGGTESMQELASCLDSFASRHPEMVEDAFLSTAKEMIGKAL
ncbi:MAG: ATP-grasp domain-containing protein [Treponema sp.]|nr:ATP-grasp domain-containing protein [Treponema sp.]